MARLLAAKMRWQWPALLVAFMMAAIVHAYPSSSNHPVKRFTLIATERVIWPDGNPVRSVLLNDSMPGPEIRVNVGDRVIIRVINHIPDQNTTLHLHGLSERMTPVSDGTPFVSQWPIAPGNFFEYELIPQPEDRGTYFYHSHYTLQALTAHGPFIVDGPVPSIHRNIQEERTVMLGDWFWQYGPSIVAGDLANPVMWQGSSKALTLNGRAIDNCNSTIAQLNANLTCANTMTTPSVVSVPYSTQVRLRLVGALALSYVSFGILGHNTTIISADGTYIEPIANQSFIEIMSGQRYDLVLDTKSETAVKSDGQNGCYWIRLEARWADPPVGGWGVLAYPDCNNSTLSAFLKSGPPLPAGTDSMTAMILPPAQFGWITSQFEPLNWPGAWQTFTAPKDSEVVRRIVIQAQMIGFGEKGSRWALNGQIYNDTTSFATRNGTSSQTPYLVKLIEKQVDAPSYERAMHGTPKGYDNVTNTYVARSGEVFDVVIVNNGSMMGHNVETHPWHGHSAKQWTMASGMGNFTEEAFAAARASGFQRPIARDTHGVWPGPGAFTTNETLPANSSGGWTVLRYRVAQGGKEAGAWLLHCHLLPHMIMGMMTTMIFDAPNLAQATGFQNNPAYLNFGNNVTSRYTIEHP